MKTDNQRTVNELRNLRPVITIRDNVKDELADYVEKQRLIAITEVAGREEKLISNITAIAKMLSNADSYRVEVTEGDVTKITITILKEEEK